MTQIALKPFQNGKRVQVPSLDIMTNAAWQFAYAALWQEQHFYPKEIDRVKKEIGDYFRSSENHQEAFATFCERVILVNRYLAAEKSRFLPHPSIWFNTHFQQGFAATLQFHKDLQIKQQEIPGYCEGINTLAHYYWLYTTKPASKAFIACRKKLLHLKEYGLIQLFYNSIIYSQILNPAS